MGLKSEIGPGRNSSRRKNFLSQQRCLHNKQSCQQDLTVFVDQHFVHTVTGEKGKLISGITLKFEGSAIQRNQHEMSTEALQFITY